MNGEKEFDAMNVAFQNAKRVMDAVNNPSDIRRAGITGENIDAMIAKIEEAARIARIRLNDFIREDGTYSQK